MEIKQEDALQAFLLEVHIEGILHFFKKQNQIWCKIESVKTERRSANAAIHAGVVAFRVDATQIGISQGCWNQDG